MTENPDELIRAHYREQARKHGPAASSTMEDQVTRQKEIAEIERFLGVMQRRAGGTPLRMLDLGCGNGYVLSLLSALDPKSSFVGVDFTDELVEVARARGLANCEFLQGDARSLKFPEESFDAVYTERALINLLEWESQQHALLEIHRVLRDGGHYLMIECFTDGLENNNRARAESGLEPLQPAYHNRYFDKEAFLEFIDGRFAVVDPSELGAGDGLRPNFLSSHYFIARVLAPLVNTPEHVKNTEFVKFFSFLPPSGNYSPIQCLLLEKR